MNPSNTMKSTTYWKKLSALMLASSLTVVGTVAFLPSNVSVAQAAISSTHRSTSAIQVQVEGKAVHTQGMLSHTGKLLVPLKDVAKATGASVTYNAKTHIISVKQGELLATYEVYSGTGDDGVYVSFNGGTVGDAYESQIIKGLSYVDIKALSETFGYRALWSHTNRTVNLTKDGVNQVAVTPTTLNTLSTNSNLIIHMVYPVVSGLDNAAAQASINQALKDHYDQFLSAMLKQTHPSGASAKMDESAEIDGGYKVTYNQNGVISFLLTNYLLNGSAKGDDTLTGMTFSLKDGKLIQLDDILKSNPNYRHDLKKLLQDDIRKHGDEMMVSLKQFNQLSTSSSDYLNNFYLTDQGFTVCFSKYAIGPGAAGHPEFAFTFRQLLKSGNPLRSYS
ncbi:stalk domain-containing protein [Paenibacillus kandeliae]|uniref:stalk domain-containing protein n=1 Tax=Paenibacillus kandeliae TaxID=3231269 RepID=UPI00345B0EAC